MTKADAARLVAIVVTAYPNFDKFKDAKAIEATVNLWAMMFEHVQRRTIQPRRSLSPAPASGGAGR